MTTTTTTSTIEINFSYGLVVVIASIVFMIVEGGLMIVYGIFIGLNPGNSGLYALMILNIIFAAISIGVGILSAVSNLNIVERLRDCLRPAQFILYVIVLIAFCVLAICCVVLNAIIFSFTNLTVLATIVIIITIVAFLVMIILSAINVGWVRCRMVRSN